MEPPDLSRIHVLPLSQRRHYIRIADAAADPYAAPADPGPVGSALDRLAEAVISARKRGASVMATYGAHLIKTGCGPYLRWLAENGWISHLATQGAGIIHDWEFAYLGASSESVRDNAPVGRFGTWDETGRWINLAVAAGAADGRGFGESIGRLIHRGVIDLPKDAALDEQIRREPDHRLTGARADLLRHMKQHRIEGPQQLEHAFRQYSVTSAAAESSVPLTVHPGLGYDIFACHPHFNGAAVGRASQTDFNLFVESVMNLNGGVYLSIGSAIMSPQVFEKAFSVANNLLEQQGKPFLSGHRIAVVDLQDGGGWDWSAKGEPPMDHPAYYLRWCKTFHRMGGSLDYLQMDMGLMLSNLVWRLRDAGT